ncbi:hypothetical protein L1987_53944 [Smallanthus sonchifolius]|uniref:Uncharacterized protein n=1 Tax=Smallanthus sonchifolius TaxID=185202 RepID=A0ACB9E6U9_9ASTR|nr:hypothetical protein L1987_53944 [Smallanthus sonchifolius]
MDKNDMLYQLVPSAKLLASLYEGEEVRVRDTLFFVDKELGKGSHGTVVYEGGIVVGLGELHKLRIIHGDLRPSHVLISKEKDVLYPKLSGMGSSRCLAADESSLGPNAKEVCLRAKSKDEKARSIVAALESKACVAFYGTWDCSMDRAFITQVIKHRQFRYDSVQDLLRFIAIASKKYRFSAKSIQVRF